jgi:transposase
LIVENSAEGFRHLLSQVRFYMDREALSRVVFGLEPTSVYHQPLAEHLIEQGHVVVYATNEAIKKNRSLLDGRWDKHDTKDSANVAELVAQGKCHFYDLPELRLRDLRSLLLLRKRLKKQQHSCRVRIRNNLVAQYFLELDRFWNNAAAENLAIVRGFLDPSSIRKLTCERFITQVTTHNGGLRQQRRLRHIWETAGNSIGCRPGVAVPVISKKGKADLRYALYQAALVASSLTTHFRAHYSRLLEGRQREQGIRTKMLVKIAVKMLVIAWTLMKRKEPFNPAYIQA